VGSRDVYNFDRMRSHLGGIYEVSMSNGKLIEQKHIEETALFKHVSEIIETRKARAGAYANCEITMMYWEIGQYIGSVLLSGERAEYGKRIVAELAQQLMKRYGNSFERTKITRMIKFAKLFPDYDIVADLAQQLSWSHFQELLPVKSDDARIYYAQDVVNRRIGTKELRRQVSRKIYERNEIANIRLSEQTTVPFNVFKDPYMLDILDLKENYLEADIEKAILVELEKFILEIGNGFSFVARQKRIVIDGDDTILDLLFYNRIIKRLVVIELKLGEFKAAYKGPMELQLKWLDRNERKSGEEAPIGLILCATASREKIEMLELDKSGIAVAEYWTTMPPKKEFEQKLSGIMKEARERVERRKSLTISNTKKDIDYFYESKDDDDD